MGGILIFLGLLGWADLNSGLPSLSPLHLFSGFHDGRDEVRLSPGI